MTRRASPIRGLAVAALVAVGCRGAGCAPSGGAKAGNPCGEDHALLVEVRDGQGALQLGARALAPDGGAASLCDGAGRLLGVVRAAPDGSFALAGPGGEPIARSALPEGGDSDRVLHLGLPGCRPDDPLAQAGLDGGASPVRCGSLRVHAAGALVRILDERGVPVGQVGRPEPRARKAVAYDPGGRPLATADRVEPDDETRLAVSDPDGKLLYIVVGLRDERAAAAFALPLLEPPVRLLLARLLQPDDKR